MYSDYNILVIGDGMIDEWVEGVTECNEHDRNEIRMANPARTRTLGGVYNVAVNFRSLGANVNCISKVGHGDIANNLFIISELEKGSIENTLFGQAYCTTTIQERYFCDNRYRTWVSYTKTANASKEIADNLHRYLRGMMYAPDALVIWDYDEGMMTESTITMLLSWARTSGIPVVVDPKLNNFKKYKSVEVLKSNDNEAIRAVGANISLAEHVREELNCRYAVVTRGDQGISVSGNNVSLFIKSSKVDNVVCDVGAGDTTLAALTLEYLVTGDIEQACRVGNVAGSLAVQNKYCGSITVDDLVKSNAW